MTEPEPQNELDAVLDWALDRYPHEIIPALRELDALRDERKNVDALVEMLRVARTERDALRAQVAELETQLSKTRNSWTVQQGLLQDACDAHGRAVHDRDRYREALERIAAMTDITSHISAAREVAVAALNPKQ
jgi:hypothetical protein